MSGLPVLYGISNCDTVKKARRWFESQGIEYRFHDFRKDGLDQKHVSDWFSRADWEQMLNRRSRTWRELPEKDKQDLSPSKAGKLILAQPSLIKRPVLDVDGQLVIGFDETHYKAILKR